MKRRWINTAVSSIALIVSIFAWPSESYAGAENGDRIRESRQYHFRNDIFNVNYDNHFSGDHFNGSQLKGNLFRENHFDANRFNDEHLRSQDAVGRSGFQKNFQAETEDPLLQLGYTDEKYALIFGSVGNGVYQSAAEAEANMVSIPIDVWQLNEKGEKYAARH